MSNGLLFKRILLKLSGEALGGGAGVPLDTDAIAAVAARIHDISQLGAEVAVVVGGGNFFRGLPASRRGIERTTADNIGMLATVMNGLALRDGLEAAGQPAELQSAFDISGIAHLFEVRRARQVLAQGTTLVLTGGTGHPFFTTDTTAALRACQIGANALLKATKVDGIYSADPKTNPDAVRYERVTYSEALQQRLGVMDSTAFSLCMDNDIPIVVFNFSDATGLQRVLAGDMSGATVVGNTSTQASATGG
jgi:uridylate kinase